jgi:hypothetical protein
MIANNKAPADILPFQLIQCDALFKLNVDDDIWQDVDLDDDYDAIPHWLGDKVVQDGIWCMLQLDRCCKEEVWLQRECCALQEWFIEEWECEPTSATSRS